MKRFEYKSIRLDYKGRGITQEINLLDIDGERVSFKYYSADLNKYFSIEENVNFESDMIIGNGIYPFELSAYDAELNPGLHISSEYPNPFNPVTNIEYTISQAGNVEIIVYDVMGRKIDTIHNEFKSNGTHSITWDASNRSSGIYYLQIKSNDSVKTQKVVLLK